MAKPDSVSMVTLLLRPRLASCDTTELMAEIELAMAATRAASPARMAEATSKPSTVAITTAVTPLTSSRKFCASRAAMTFAVGDSFRFTDMAYSPNMPASSWASRVSINRMTSSRLRTSTSSTGSTRLCLASSSM